MIVTWWLILFHSGPEYGKAKTSAINIYCQFIFIANLVGAVEQ